MKKYRILALALVSVLLFSCKEKGTVNIDTLQVFGEEFGQGQGVKVALSVWDSNQDLYYDWTCEEGAFLNSQQGYMTNTWTSPYKDGTYTISCKVSIDGKSETRQADIKIRGILQDRFADHLHGWSAGTNTEGSINNYRLEANVKSSNASSTQYGSYAKTLSVPDFLPPFSLKADVGIVSGKSYPVSSTKGWDNDMYIAVNGSTPEYELAPNYYIKNLCLFWWPKDHMASSYTYTDYTGVEQTIDASEFDAAIIVEYVYRADAATGRPEEALSFMIPFQTSALKSDAGVTKNVGMTLDQNYGLKIYVADIEIFSTTAIQTWRSSYENAALYIGGVTYRFPSSTTVFLDNVTMNYTTTFLE